MFNYKPTKAQLDFYNSSAGRFLITSNPTSASYSWIKNYFLRSQLMAQQDRMLQFFEYSHLPEQLQYVSKPFYELAHKIVFELPPNPERTVSLRKLLEAKDAAVRTKLFKETPKE